MTALLLAALLVANTNLVSISTGLVGEAYRVTGYTALDHCAPDDPGAVYCDGLTASGTRADPSLRIAACPPSMEFGARVWIEDLGAYTCRDRGSAIVGKRLDVLVASAAEARALTRTRRVWRLEEEEYGEL